MYKILNENDREAMDPAIEATYSKEELNDIFLQIIKEILISKQAYNLNMYSVIITAFIPTHAPILTYSMEQGPS